MNLVEIPIMMLVLEVTKAEIHWKMMTMMEMLPELNQIWRHELIIELQKTCSDSSVLPWESFCHLRSFQSHY